MLGRSPISLVLEPEANALDSWRGRYLVYKLVRRLSCKTTKAYLHCAPRIFSAFFRNGQVLKTIRGDGIYQPAVDAAIEKLAKGEWVSYTVPVTPIYTHHWPTDPPVL